MTVTTTTTYSELVGNGSATAFPFAFAAPSADEVKVRLDGVVQSGGYSITLSGSGGTVTFDTAPANGVAVLIESDPDFTQNASFSSEGDFNPATFDRVHDRLTTYALWLRQRVAALFPFSFPDTAARAGKFLGFDAGGNGVLLSGTGNDAAFRTDAAASTGSSLVGFLQSGTGASAEAVQDALRRGFIYPHQFLSPGQVLGAGSNDFSAFQKMLDASEGRICAVPYDSSGYRIDGILQGRSNLVLVGIGRPTLYSTVAGKPILTAYNFSNVIVRDLGFQGADATTVPTDSVLVYDPANIGLLTFAECADVLVEGCYFDLFYNGLTQLNCQRVWDQRNRVRRFYRQGILASLSREAWIAQNHIGESQVVTGTQSYGIQCTGDAAGSGPQGAAPSTSITIDANLIDGVPAWDGIMTHDADVISITRNKIKNVRMGVDIGDFQAANAISNVLISGNQIVATTTDTWGGASANHFGIGFVGLNASERDVRVSVTDNLVHGFFNIAGMTGTPGVSSHITIGNADHVLVADNQVTGGGSAYANAGFLAFGTVNDLQLCENSFQGAMTSAGVRLSSLTANIVGVGLQKINQTNASDPAIQYSGTIGNLSLTMPATNSTVPISASGTVAYAPGRGPVFKGSTTYDPPSLAAATRASTTVTVTGAVVGDRAEVSLSIDPQGVKVEAQMSGVNTATVYFDNPPGASTVDLGSCTVTVTARRQ